MSLICYYMYNIVNSLEYVLDNNFDEITRQCTRACKWLVHGTCVCIDNKLDSSYTNALSTSLTSLNISLYSGLRVQ